MANNEWTLVESKHVAERKRLSWELKRDGKAVVKYVAPYVDLSTLTTSNNMYNLRQMLVRNRKLSQMLGLTTRTFRRLRALSGTTHLISTDEFMLKLTVTNELPRKLSILHVISDDETTLHITIPYATAYRLIGAVARPPGS